MAQKNTELENNTADKNEKQEAITGKNKRLAELFRIDKAVAWIALGEFSKAKELLESFQKELFAANGNTLIIYYIDLISCYYELGEYELAEQIFETKLPLLSPTITRVKQSVNILVGERYFFQGKHEQSREHFSKILEKKLSPRVNLSIIYRLAQMDEIEGMTEQAKEKYEKVASEGNKLYIAKKSAVAMAG